jgi:hypothetical protein
MDWRIYFWVVWVVESLGIPKLYPTATLPYTSSHLGLGVLIFLWILRAFATPQRPINSQQSVTVVINGYMWQTLHDSRFVKTLCSYNFKDTTFFYWK